MPWTPVNLNTIQVHNAHMASDKHPSSFTEKQENDPEHRRFIKRTNIQQTTDDAVDMDKTKLLLLFNES
jgi:hypothetical protein